MRQADAVRVQAIKQPTQPTKSVVRDKDAKPWQRDCPKCHAMVHVRKKVCDCGHVLIASKE